MYNMFNITLAGNGTTTISKKENIAELSKMAKVLARIFGSNNAIQRVNDVVSTIGNNI